MKTYRRVEIAAFRRRVTIVSGEETADVQANQDVRLMDADMHETIETESEEGQRLFFDVADIERKTRLKT